MTSGSEVTRDQVSDWLEQYGKINPPPDLREFLLGKLGEAGVEEPMIDTRYREEFGDETHVVDMILADLESYAT